MVRLGKRGRAGLVAARCAQGKVRHHGTLHALEHQMCRVGAPGFGEPPDRVDALVWTIWALMLVRTTPRVRVVW